MALNQGQGQQVVVAQLEGGVDHARHPESPAVEVDRGHHEGLVDPVEVPVRGDEGAEAVDLLEAGVGRAEGGRPTRRLGQDDGCLRRRSVQGPAKAPGPGQECGRTPGRSRPRHQEPAPADVAFAGIGGRRGLGRDRSVDRRDRGRGDLIGARRRGRLGGSRGVDRGDRRRRPLRPARRRPGCRSWGLARRPTSDGSAAGWRPARPLAAWLDRPWWRPARPLTSGAAAGGVGTGSAADGGGDLARRRRAAATGSTGGRRQVAASARRGRRIA